MSGPHETQIASAGSVEELWPDIAEE